MRLLQKLLNKLNGLHYPQEYLCLASESFQNQLRAYVVRQGRVTRDITNLHIFAGYSPLIFALVPLKETGQDEMMMLDILFTGKLLLQNEAFPQKAAIAMLTLKRIRQPVFADNMIWYYEGIKGKHHFLSAFHQWIVGLNNRLSNKKAGNVFLYNNLYKQVQIAYALPRNISLITVGEKERYNLFPTDLHGQLDEQHYIISLRQEGKACRQVTETRKILLTQVQAGFYKTAYALGKNHMQDCRKKENFPFSDAVSPEFRLPVPDSAIFYRELELQNSFVHGIHRLLLFKIVSRQPLQENSSALAHIHNAYATWRYNNQMTGNYLLR